MVLGGEGNLHTRRIRHAVGGQMTGKSRLPRWLLGAALLAAIDGAGLTGADVALMSSAQAQGVFPFFGGGGQQNQRSRSGGGFFGGLFGGFDRPSDNY